jgi:hypothetical protein
MSNCPTCRGNKKGYLIPPSLQGKPKSLIIKRVKKGRLTKSVCPTCEGKGSIGNLRRREAMWGEAIKEKRIANFIVDLERFNYAKLVSHVKKIYNDHGSFIGIVFQDWPSRKWIQSKDAVPVLNTKAILFETSYDALIALRKRG